MTLKVSNRTNAPRTCLWCGQKLSERTMSEDRSVTPDVYAALRDKPRAARRLDGLRVSYLASPERVGVHVPTGEYGPYGDGFFCTLNCASLFGVSAARNGYRFKPTAEQGKP